MNLKKLGMQAAAAPLLLLALISLSTYEVSITASLIAALIFGVPGGALLYLSAREYENSVDLIDAGANMAVGLLSFIYVGTVALSIESWGEGLFLTIMWLAVVMVVLLGNLKRYETEITA